MSAWRIPFNRAGLVGSEFLFMREAVENGHIAGDGAFARRSEALLEEIVGSKRALVTPSCTHALELAALLLEITDGDEVIVPSFTFSSTATAFALRGARIVFADIRSDTLSLDESQVPDLVSDRTRAIVPMHYGGVACEVEPILRLAERHGIAVVEDNAHGLFGTYHGRPLGSFGSFAVQSFHETKNVTCGEGGALLINEPSYIERAEVIRDKGTNRKKFFRGEVDQYTWVDLGSSYVLSEISAAFLTAQLEARESIQLSRREIWDTYAEGLSSWATGCGAGLPCVPDHCQQAYHLFYVVLPSAAYRSALIEHLRARGILAVFHYIPLHLSAMGRRFGGEPGQCPVSEDVSDRLLRLHFFTGLQGDDQEQVIDAITAFRG